MSGGGDWSSLAGDLLEQVADRLSSTERDLIHVRQVCAHWRHSVTSRPVAPYRPWIVAGRACPHSRGPRGEYALCLPLGGRQRIHVSGPPGLPYCCGTPRGWLALTDHEWCPTRLVLWEPGSGAEVALPPLRGVDDVQVFLSDDPRAPGSWVAVATQGGKHPNVVCWRPGFAAWSVLLTDIVVHSVAFHGGKMYCMLPRKIMRVYDLDYIPTGAAAAASPPVLKLLSGRGYDGVREARHASLRVVICDGEPLIVLGMKAKTKFIG